jgi:hypothetical protein
LRALTCCRKGWSAAWTSCTTPCSTRRAACRGSAPLRCAIARRSPQFTRLRCTARPQGTGFPLAERDRLGIRGLVPPRHLDIEEQAAKLYEEYLRRPTNLDKWLALQALQDRNETLFYKIIIDHGTPRARSARLQRRVLLR